MCAERAPSASWRSRTAALDEWPIKTRNVALYDMAAGGAAYTSSTVRDVSGEPPRTFADFVDANLAAFRSH